MNRVVLLDTGIIGLITNPKRAPESLAGSKSVLSEHKYYSIAKDCYLGKHSGV